ncbi:NAD(P)-dependent alcohol dehydrogenase [Algoriphagus confluentis]|uniref:NAD(P)-dependent alcohol dehydrogenase n=1 Tax=Algoriphagus confluentis TaxID=1697556 RepID=A0ABQ6PMY9_9BACT|nr:NAD(P)-dependent alcohol dehydrogenase [Algoriphagus confluentis]
MKACLRLNYGPPETFQVADISKPAPKPDEVLVRVMATTVNRTDIGVSTGKPYAIRAFTGLFSPKIPVTGTDFAGVIEELGAEVTDFHVGDRVWGFDDNGAGTHAEYVTFPISKAMLKIPEGVDFDFMVACAEGTHYAVNFINKVNLTPDMQVLVIGGTGAIGSAAIQILKAMQVQVTAVCFEADLEIVKALGPDRVIALEREAFTRDLGAYDFVFDSVGKSRFSICKPVLKEKGVYISSELGPNWENLAFALKGRFAKGKRVIFPIPSDIPASMKTVTKLVEWGKFKPLMDSRKFTPIQIKEAFSYVASGKKTGNVVLHWH